MALVLQSVKIPDIVSVFYFANDKIYVQYHVPDIFVVQSSLKPQPGNNLAIHTCGLYSLSSKKDRVGEKEKDFC